MDIRSLTDAANERGRRAELLKNRSPRCSGLESLQPSQRFDDLWSRACMITGVDESSAGGNVKITHSTNEGHKYVVFLDFRNQFPSQHHSHDKIINFKFFLGENEEPLCEADEALSRDKIIADPENQEVLDELGSVENSMHYLELLLDINGEGAERFAYSEGQLFE